MHSVSALLPMKGQSERIKDKNTRPLNGKPLFHYVMESLLASKYISEIIVNSDCPQIEESLKKYFPSVKFIQRPTELLGAKVPMTPIIAHDLKYSSNEHFLQTHATNPFLKASTIDKGIEEYFKSISLGYDSAFAVTGYQTRFYDNKATPINHDLSVMVPSQDMPYIYEDNSNFYINSKQNFSKHNNRIGHNPKLIPMNKIESHDIDEVEDWVIAEAIATSLGEHHA